MRKALITGVTGQDGSYLAEFLLEKGYEVHGMLRRSSVDYHERISHIQDEPNFRLHYGDMGDSMSIMSVISTVRPDEIYNLAAQSHVQVSFDVPEFTADVDAIGVLRILEAVRLCGLGDKCRIYQASTSELFGKVEEVRFPHTVHTLQLNSTGSGLQKSIGRHIICSAARGFFLTMNRSAVGRHL